MFRFLSATLALCAICSCAYCADVELTSISVQPAKPNPNLLTNGSFEISNAAGFAKGWNWSATADAACVFDEDTAVSGWRSLKIVNNSPLESPYTGLLSLAKPVVIEPGKPYTISAWVKSDDPGLTTLDSGAGWRYRIGISPTGGKWVPVSITFIPDDADKNLGLYVQTESRTNGVWVDDIKLEAGESATYDQVPNGTGNSIQLWPENKDFELLTEGGFKVSYLAYVPDHLAANIEACISTSNRQIARRINLKPGLSRIVVNGSSHEAGYTPRCISLTMVSGCKKIASAQTGIKFFSQPYTKKRLQLLGQQLPSIKAKLEQLRARGQDVSYPMVSYTILENFIGYGLEDVDKNEVKRASMALSDMENIKSRLDKELAEALAGRRTFSVVPRWNGESRPIIKSSSFMAQAVTPGQVAPETRPIFFTGYGHFGQVVADIEKFPNYGVNIFQIEAGPNSTMPAEGKIVDTPGKNLIPTLDRAQKAGVAMCLLLSPHYMPGWVYEKIKSKDATSSSHYIQRDPLTHEVIKCHIATLLAPIKDHPALQSICIANEPTEFGDTSNLAVKDWHSWLQKRHGDIATLNSRWGTDYAGFDEITLPYTKTERFKEPMGRWLDCIRWNQEFVAGWYQMLADAVHEVVPNLSIHMKIQTPTLLCSGDIHSGNDPYLVGCVNDINGNDSINWYSFGLGEFATGWMTNSRGEDLQRSVKDAPVFDSENHIIGDRECRYFPPEPIYCDTWQQAIHGQSATTHWVWERTYDRNHDFYGNIMHRPACAEEVGLVNYDLNRAAKEVTALQQAPVKVAILHDSSAMIYEGLAYDDCSKKTYMALGFCGVKIGYVTERQLEAGIVPTVPVLIVPNAIHISDAAFETLQKYQGRIIMLGENLLARNEYDRPRSQHLNADAITYNQSMMEKDLWHIFLKKLPEWQIEPQVTLLGPDNKPVWGVEAKEVQDGGRILVNLCNYLNKPIVLKCVLNGTIVSTKDVLTGTNMSEVLSLKPLEVKLVAITE